MLNIPSQIKSILNGYFKIHTDLLQNFKRVYASEKNMTNLSVIEEYE